MKKLTLRYRRWLIRRSRYGQRTKQRGSGRSRSRNSRIVTAWYGDRVERVLCVREPRIPPSEICLVSNPLETLSFLDGWRERHAIKSNVVNPKRYNWVRQAKRKGQLSRIKGYVDYSKINYISTAMALIIAAEYDRARRLIESVPPTINLDEWNSRVFSKLYELGFFEIVGLSEGVDSLYHDDGDIRTMRIVSGRNAADLQSASENLIELSRYIDEDGPIGEEVLKALNSALSEAMVNVSRHAYPEDHNFAYKHVGAWWMTAAADRGNRSLTVVMYDQGASIPVTLPKKSKWRAARDFVLRNMSTHKSFEYQDDATYIEGAMRLGETQTGEPGRGEGLPQMMELIDVCRSGALTIWSRGGVCRYTQNGGTVGGNYEHSVGGTLIEWIIRLP